MTLKRRIAKLEGVNAAGPFDTVLDALSKAQTARLSAILSPGDALDVSQLCDADRCFLQTVCNGEVPCEV